MKKVIALLLACFLLTGCPGTPSAVSLLDAAVAAAEVATPVILAAAGTDPATANIANAWLTAAVTIIDDLLGAPITAASIDKAVSDFQALGQPNVPPGNVANVLAGVVKAFQVFVDDYAGSTVTTTAFLNVHANAAFPQAKPHKARNINIDAATVKKLQAIRARAQSVKRALGK